MLTFGLICALVATASAGNITINNTIPYCINMTMASRIVLMSNHIFKWLYLPFNTQEIPQKKIRQTKLFDKSLNIAIHSHMCIKHKTK